MVNRILAMAAVAFWMVVAVAKAADPIGQVVALVNQATATGVDGTVRVLALKSPIFLNDKLVTAKDAKVQLMFNDDSMISQGPSAEMVIDDYVYAPKTGKDGNCSLKLMKGAFRVITGKITDLNPERFKVHTKMATIGIRGCELGFRLRKDSEDIYILYLPRGRSILIERLREESEKSLQDRILTILQSGVAVTIRPGAELRERRFQPVEARQIFEESSPAPSGGRGRASDSTQKGESVGDPVALQQAAQQTTSGANQTLAGQALQLKSKADLVVIPPLPSASSGPKTGPPSDMVPEDRGPPVLVGGNPDFSDWEWGIWEDGSVEYHGNRYLGDTFLSDQDYADIIGGTTLYTLKDDMMGQAAAVVKHGGNTTLLDMGFVTMQVEVGAGATPRWGGEFTLNNMAGNGLHFEVDYATGGGSIGSGGRLSLNSLSTYSLNVGGPTLTESSLTSQSISGHLIRPASGSPAINALAGEFHFTHGTDASVDGAFGSNLIPVVP